MGTLTTHVLDTAHGKPGVLIPVSIYKVSPERELIASFYTNNEGRTNEPILSEATFELGSWELKFSVADYFDKTMANPDQLPFLDEIFIRFRITTNDHYHVPLLVSPWSYSTYRGS